MEASPTKRFMIEPSLDCQLECAMCYHIHKKDQWKQTIKPLDDVKKEIDAGVKRGNTWMDITGGEPTIYPHILETVKYAKDQGLKVCIITNGLMGRKRVEELRDAGLDEFLVSVHGLKSTHDEIIGCQGFDTQTNFLNEAHIAGISLRFNTVISSYNQRELSRIAAVRSNFKPKIWNFINMNPHGAWANDIEKTRGVIADFKVAQPELEAAIDYLEAKGIGVNLRYYPMCRIKEEYRRCVCNDLHVMQDSHEWDYGEMPKTYDQYRQWGINTSNNIENKEKPCSDCGLQWICGGVNKAYFKAAGPDCVTAQFFDGDKNEFFYYRQHATTL